MNYSVFSLQHPHLHQVFHPNILPTDSLPIRACHMEALLLDDDGDHSDEQQQHQEPGAAGGKRLAHRVEIDDLVRTTHDPLLAQLRYRLRRQHGASREGKKIGFISRVRSLCRLLSWIV